MTLDKTDDEIIVALTHEVRLLSKGLLEKHCWRKSGVLGKEEAGKRINNLVEQGFLTFHEILARPALDLVEPVIDWQPESESIPVFGKASYRLKKRWKELPEPTEVVIATKEASKRYGGYGGGYLPRADERTHDIHVGELWSRYLRMEWVHDRMWVGEGRLRSERASERFDGRIPDAILRQAGSADPTLIVEFGGAYAASKLAAIHEAFCRYPYVVW